MSAEHYSHEYPLCVGYLTGSRRRKGRKSQKIIPVPHGMQVRNAVAGIRQSWQGVPESQYSAVAYFYFFFFSGTLPYTMEKLAYR